MSCCMHLMKSIEHDWSVARHVDICTIEKGCKNQPGSWWAGYPLGSLESESDYSSQRFIERWGLHEPLSLGITTNGIRCAQWMGCENTGKKNMGCHDGMGCIFFSQKIPCEVKILGSSTGAGWSDSFHNCELLDWEASIWVGCLKVLKSLNMFGICRPGQMKTL